MTTRFIDHLLTGDHASRPAANAVPDGTLYSCTDHSLVYQSDGASWSTWANLAGTGAVATDTIWDAAGDLAVGTGANTAAKLTVGAASKVPTSNGTTLAYAYPPGYEFDYAEITSPASITAVAGVGADTVITGASVSYDGSTIVLIEFFAPNVNPSNSAIGRLIYVRLFEDSTELGAIYANGTPAAQFDYKGAYGARRLTPSNASHTYTIKANLSAAGTGTITCGAGTGGAYMPAYMRITKVA